MQPSRRVAKFGGSSAQLSILLFALVGCESCLSRHQVDSVPERGYPTCDGEPLPEGELLSEGVLRAGPYMRDPVIERFAIRRRGCIYSITVRQEWPRQVSDVEALFDENWRPIRAWKRMVAPADPEETEDTRLYEPLNEPPTMSERTPDGLAHREFRGANPVAFVGPGRAILTAWIRAENLEVGETARGPVLDFRELYERIEEVAIRRDADREEPTLGGRSVRVYTVFGRESVFTDETGLVIGDLAGLRRHEDLDSPMPPALEEHAPADPTAPL